MMATFGEWKVVFTRRVCCRRSDREHVFKPSFEQIWKGRLVVGHGSYCASKTIVLRPVRDALSTVPRLLLGLQKVSLATLMHIKNVDPVL